MEWFPAEVASTCCGQRHLQPVGEGRMMRALGRRAGSEAVRVRLGKRRRAAPGCDVPLWEQWGQLGK